MLALHGFTGSGLDFLPIAAKIAAHRRVSWIAPDLPGHGLTGSLDDPTAFSLSSMAAVLDRLVRHRAIKPIVMGYSMGGRLALEWATTHPIKHMAKLVIVSTTAGIENDIERWERRREDLALANQIRAIGSARFAEKWERKPIIRTQSAIPEADRQPMELRRRNQDPEGLARSLEQAGTGIMDPRWNRLANVDCPTLVISGQNDLKFSQINTKLTAEIRDAQSSVLLQAGHCSHLENQKQFVYRFLRFGFAKSRD